MGEGCAFDVPRRAAQERTEIFRMDFPHSMRPSNDAEFPGPENVTRGVGRSKPSPKTLRPRQRPYKYIYYSIDAEFPGPVGPGRGALGAASLRESFSGQSSAATYMFDTCHNKSERG